MGPEWPEKRAGIGRFTRFLGSKLLSEVRDNDRKVPSACRFVALDRARTGCVIDWISYVRSQKQ